MPASDRVRERRKAAALARHYRDEENLTIAEIARRLGRAEATVKAYLYDPSQANKRPSDSRQERQFWGVWSCTDVDLQATPGLSLRRHEAGVRPTARFVPATSSPFTASSAHGRCFPRAKQVRPAA